MAKVDLDGYPVAPRNLSDTLWFYEQKEGLVVCIRDQRTVTAVLPWSKICKAVDNHRTLKGRKHAR